VVKFHFRYTYFDPHYTYFIDAIPKTEQETNERCGGAGLWLQFLRGAAP
jgi:hypothetical protein